MINLNSAYSAIMDHNANPLRGLPRAQCFQVMLLLSVVWTTAFCLAIGSFLWWGELVAVHLALGLAALITGLTFKLAEKPREMSEPATLGD